MTDRSSLHTEIQRLLQSQLLAVLSTHQEGQPYANLIAFVADDDLGRIYFATGRSTQKFTNIMQDNRIALLIDNRSNQQDDFQSAAAVTVTGGAHELHGEARSKIEKLYLSRHPNLQEFIREPSTALMQVQVMHYIMVTRFQQTLVLDMRH